MILLQVNNPYNLTVVVGPGEKLTVPVVPSGKYCIMELPMDDNFDSEIRYTIEFIAEEDATASSSITTKGLDDANAPVDKNIIISKTWEWGDSSGLN